MMERFCIVYQVVALNLQLISYLNNWMSKHKSEQVALNIYWDVYGLINKINKIFRGKMWVADEAEHM